MRARLLLPLVLALLSPSAASTQRPNDTVEGTWRLIAWRMGRDTLTVPNVSGYWSLHDGLVQWQVRGQHADSVYDLVATGRYELHDSVFVYWYDSGLQVERLRGKLSAVVHDSLPFREHRAFRAVRVGQTRTYRTADGKQNYIVRGDTLEIVQNALLSRRYVRYRRQ